MQREIEGAISMTKTIMVLGNPPAHQTLNTPINSIVAAAKTAHELESARRKATRDKAIQRLDFRSDSAKGFFDGYATPPRGERGALCPTSTEPRVLR
jgi:hypothetical protein